MDLPSEGYVEEQYARLRRRICSSAATGSHWKGWMQKNLQDKFPCPWSIAAVSAYGQTRGPPGETGIPHLSLWYLTPSRYCPPSKLRGLRDGRRQRYTQSRGDKVCVGEELRGSLVGVWVANNHGTALANVEQAMPQRDTVHL